MQLSFRRLAFLFSRNVALFLFAFALCSLTLPAQDRSAELQTAFARARHLEHGINASEWFAQSADYSAARTN